MLTKDQAKIIELNFIRVIDCIQHELNNAINTHSKPDLTKVIEVHYSFYDYIDSITEE